MNCTDCEKDCPNPLVCEDYLADVRKRAFCTKCGKDITYRVKVYVHGYKGGAYCYDCAELEKGKLKNKKLKLQKQAKRMYKSGMKVSEIASEMQMSKTDIYRMLGGEK